MMELYLQPSIFTGTLPFTFKSTCGIEQIMKLYFLPLKPKHLSTLILNTLNPLFPQGVRPVTFHAILNNRNNYWFHVFYYIQFQITDDKIKDSEVSNKLQKLGT
jgi:hypothetical protein